MNDREFSNPNEFNKLREFNNTYLSMNMPPVQAPQFLTKLVTALSSPTKAA
jgi:hypothetical protein